MSEEAKKRRRAPSFGLGKWLRIDPANKPAIYTQVYASAEISNANYWAEIVLSAAIAAFGLVLNSPAVIIGAMLISPLMGPIMATGLGLAVGDLYLVFKAVANLLASIALAVLLSGFIVWLLPFHSATAEIIARINPTLLDLGVALLSGLAGSIAVSRAGGSGGVTTLPGVAIAVALMPPLCTVGFGLGSGANLRIMGGAGLLFLTNIVAIVASAFVVFLSIGLNSPEIRAEMLRARQEETFARKLAAGPLARLVAGGGQLHWRILMLVVLLGSIAVPLRTALMQVASDTVARSAVQEALNGLIPRGALVSQQVEVARGSISIQLVSTKAIPAAEVHAAERRIQQRSGRTVRVTVASVASQSELEALMQKFATAAQPLPPPPPEGIEDMLKDLNGRVKPVLDGVWPQEAPLQDYNVAFAPEGVVLNARYQAKKDLDPIAVGLITKELQNGLKDPALTVALQRVPPPRPARRGAR